MENTDINTFKQAHKFLVGVADSPPVFIDLVATACLMLYLLFIVRTQQ